MANTPGNRPAGRQRVGKGGIVAKAATHRDVLKEIVDFMPGLGWQVAKLDFSPIAGGDGNIEFLADIKPASDCIAPVDVVAIDAVVRRAHAANL